jgi:predicted alpha/beta hydrolase family esterase
MWGTSLRDVGHVGHLASRYGACGAPHWGIWGTSLRDVGHVGHLSGAYGAPRFDVGHVGQSELYSRTTMFRRDFRYLDCNGFLKKTGQFCNISF